MEASSSNLQQLGELIGQLLAPNSVAIKAAEKQLKNLESKQGFTLCLLHLIGNLSLSTLPHDIGVRQTAAVLFKNAVKKGWKIDDDDTSSSNANTNDNISLIPEIDRNPIKQNLVDLMSKTPPEVQKQLAEAVNIISSHDFPNKWNELLPQLVSRLNTTDLTIINGVMLTANSVMKRFRYVHKSDELYLVLLECLNQFAQPLLNMYASMKNKVQELTTGGESMIQQLKLVFETIRLMTRIYFSLNWQDIPEFFENNIQLWMTEFSFYLSYSNPLLINNNEDMVPGPIEKLQANIIENLNLYASKYEEEFAPFLDNFTQLIWQMLVTVPSKPKYDSLATNGIVFLTSVCAKEMNKGLFTEAILQQIIEQIVVKNLTATDDDEELFEMNASDYIRKDMEGSDQNTRRRCAMELVRSLLKFFNEPVTKMCLNYITALLEQYQSSNMMNWKAKDAALHLVLAVSVISSSALTGASTLNPKVNILDIFNSHVMPEVSDRNVNDRPIVKADAIKLVLMFRMHFGVDFMLQQIPLLIAHLKSEHVVVQTYASMCIERFLCIKDTSNDGKVTTRIGKETLTPHLNPLFAGLFECLENEEVPENDYVMKCIMRVLILIGNDVAPITELVLNKFTKALQRVCANPANPQFNHYLFECLAVLIRSLCDVPGQNDTTRNEVCQNFERLLFPPFQSVLNNDVTEFIPYVFQVLAQMLFYRPSNTSLSDAYRTLFPPLLSPQLWESKGNVPALTELFKAYITRGMGELVRAGHLQPMLGVFQKLLSNRSTEIYAFSLFIAIVTESTVETLGPFIPVVFDLILTKLMKAKSNSSMPLYTFHTITYLSIKFGPTGVYSALEGIQLGMVEMLVTKVFINNIGLFCSTDKRSIWEMIVGGCKLICNTKALESVTCTAAMFKVLVNLSKHLNSSQNNSKLNLSGSNSDEINDDSIGNGDKGFDSTYSRLVNAYVPRSSAAVEVQNWESTLCNIISSSGAPPSHYGHVVRMMDVDEVNLLTTMMQTHGVKFEYQ